MPVFGVFFQVSALGAIESFGIPVVHLLAIPDLFLGALPAVNVALAGAFGGCPIPEHFLALGVGPAEVAITPIRFVFAEVIPFLLKFFVGQGSLLDGGEHVDKIRPLIVIGWSMRGAAL
jgi:hypothetical protein